MVVNSSSELTEHEEELYDRQIRLWGLESQKRLRAARVLIIGLSGFGAEVAKNVILAGVKAVTLLDNAVVTELDAHSQFLAPTDAVGSNRAEASLERAQALNPLVAVSADKESVDSKQDEFFAFWEVIVASGLSTAQYIRINSLARANSIKFFAGDVFGLFGYMFADLQSHEYVEEVAVAVVKPVKMGDQTKQKIEQVINTEKKKIEFPSYDDAMCVDFTLEDQASKLTKIDPCYFVMKALLKFRSTQKRDPDPSKVEEDMKTLLELRDAEISRLSYPKEKIPDIMFRSVFSQISPVCAIVGGVLGQEVIKAVSKKDTPHNNMFFFNPLTNTGQIACVGS